MATHYSAQVTLLDSNPQDKVDAPVWNGRMHVYYFSWTGDAAQDELIELLRLPVGCMVVHGRLDFTDLVGDVTLDIGTAADEDHWLAALDVNDAAGNADFANTVALNMMSERLTAAQTSVWAKLEGGNPASGTLKGYMVVVVP